jgi:hypothetical protein
MKRDIMKQLFIIVGGCFFALNAGQELSLSELMRAAQKDSPGELQELLTKNPSYFKEHKDNKELLQVASYECLPVLIKAGANIKEEYKGMMVFVRRILRQYLFNPYQRDYPFVLDSEKKALCSFVQHKNGFTSQELEDIQGEDDLNILQLPGFQKKVMDLFNALKDARKRYEESCHQIKEA